MQTDETLMQAFCAGDREAFDLLFTRYREPVWGFFRRRVADPGRAEELAQETFLAVIQGAARYQPRAPFRSYLFGIAFNVLLAWRRKVRRRAEDDLAGHEPAAASPDPAAVLWVRHALLALDAADREMLMLREYEQLRYEEIAEVVGVPVGTVRSRLFRARLALRERLLGRAEAQGAEP